MQLFSDIAHESASDHNPREKETIRGKCYDFSSFLPEGTLRSAVQEGGAFFKTTWKYC